MPRRPVATAYTVMITMVLCMCGCVAATKSADTDTAEKAISPLPLVCPTFADVTDVKGFAGMNARQLNWLDFDEDEFPDLLVDDKRLFRNMGGQTFEEATERILRTDAEHYRQLIARCLRRRQASRPEGEG